MGRYPANVTTSFKHQLIPFMISDKQIHNYRFTVF